MLSRATARSAATPLRLTQQSHRSFADDVETRQQGTLWPQLIDSGADCWKVSIIIIIILIIIIGSSPEQDLKLLPCTTFDEGERCSGETSCVMAPCTAPQRGNHLRLGIKENVLAGECEEITERGRVCIAF